MSHQSAARDARRCFIPGMFDTGRAAQSHSAAASFLRTPEQTLQMFPALIQLLEFTVAWAVQAHESDVSSYSFTSRLLRKKNLTYVSKGKILPDAKKRESRQDWTPPRTYTHTHTYPNTHQSYSALFQIHNEPALQMCVHSATARRCQVHTHTPAHTH